MEPQEVTDVELAFPALVNHLMPLMADIPEPFQSGSTGWNRLMNDWFFSGIHLVEVVPKEGIDAEKALRHLRVVMASFAPKHEHKEAAVAYLLSEWFSRIVYRCRDAERTAP